MNFHLTTVTILLGSVIAAAQMPGVALAQDDTATEEPATAEPAIDEVKSAGALLSSYRKSVPQTETYKAPQADLRSYRAEIEPTLKKACYNCHGSETAEGDFRVDTLDPDLPHGEDVDWWLEVSAAVTNGEMPPEDGPELTDDDRSKIIEWLAHEIQVASQIRPAASGHSSFRRMTRYEYNYTLQDLLGLPFDFAKDLPPDPVSEHGFKNSSEMLHMTAKQYADYLEINRSALKRATVRGERPEVLYWGVSAERAATRKVKTRQELDGEIKKNSNDSAEKKAKENTEVQVQAAEKSDRKKGGRDRGKGTHYLNTETGATSPANWAFRRAVNAWAPTLTRPEVPEPSKYIAVLPAGKDYVVELGNRLPDEGTLRVRIRASKASNENDQIPSMALEFGWQGSNNSKASIKISKYDLEIDASPGQPKFYQWDIPLSEIYPRNPVRKTVELGTRKMTNPSEYIRLRNTSYSQSADIHFDYVEVSAPVYDQWPPASHSAVFFDSEKSDDENTYAREIVSRFMTRSWRRTVTDAEVDLKMAYFNKIRPTCEDFQETVIEVLATVLSSPRFLYLVRTNQSTEEAQHRIDEFELATRLSMFLWCSTPDHELIDLAARRRLANAAELARQTRRMLADPRHERFLKHFVRQWLDMELLDYLTIDQSAFPQFDGNLKEAMQQEPIAFFKEVLLNDRSVMDFIHADYALVNGRLAQHYGISNVTGIGFQKVSLKPEDNRGGLLTQAGLLAMNSDGIDSHPLKRGVWLLESILNDPPPPPPPAVPEIDLTDPDILKLTLKQRIEDHRDKAACMSCHVKIDPWGIAFENFDAVGSWRTQIKGKDVDASSLLYNQHQLDGVDGLKRYLLAERQDQFARAMVHKMATFALGRPLTFGDRAKVERLVAKLRQNGDGLRTLIRLLVESDLFQKS